MLLVGGDSFSCWPLEEMDGHRDNCWPRLLANHLKLDLLDYSRAGCSNDRIFRYVLPNITSDISAIAIVWTTTLRYEFTSNDKKIHSVIPAESGYVIQDWYLNYCRTMLYVLSVQNTARLYNIPVVNRFLLYTDCWWDNTLETFKQQLDDNDYLDSLSDEMINEKFMYLRSLHNQIGSLNLEPIKDFVETSEEYQNHPTHKGHRQIFESILKDYNEIFLQSNICR